MGILDWSDIVPELQLGAPVDEGRHRWKYAGWEVVNRPPVPHCTVAALVNMVLEHQVRLRYDEVGRMPNVDGLKESGCLREPISHSTEKGVAKVVKWYVAPVQTHTDPRV